MRVQKRSWPSIVIDVLQATMTPSNKTRVMYRSNLNFDRFNRYFCDLLRKGFIEEMNSSNGHLVYKTTERGRTLLEILKTARESVFSEEP